MNQGRPKEKPEALGLKAGLGGLRAETSGSI